MLIDPFAGRATRVPERRRMLVATADGVFLWPGTALLHRCSVFIPTTMPGWVNA